MENVITLLPPFSHFYNIVLKTDIRNYIRSRTELARLVMGTIFSSNNKYSASGLVRPLFNIFGYAII